MTETMNAHPEINADGLILLSPALTEDCIETAACGVQCDCNAKL
jgi:hypothetical protein